MKKAAVKILCMLMMLFMGLTTSCTHNNGDIGELFGMWKIQSVMTSGTSIPEYSENHFMAFQSNVVTVTVNYDSGFTAICYGRWVLDGDRLSLFFEMDGFEVPPLPGISRGENVCTLKSLTSKELVFTLSDRNHPQNEYEYRLKHW